MYQYYGYKYKEDDTELKRLMRAFKGDRKLYFPTHFSGVLLYVLVLWLNLLWNPFFKAAFDVWGETVFEKLLWSNFYLTLWHIPVSVVFVELMNLIVNSIKLKRINMFFRNVIGFIGCTIQNSMTPLMLGNLIFLKIVVDGNG